MDSSLSLSRSGIFWRKPALILWILVALAYLALYLADLRLDYLQIQVPCSGPTCNYLAISSAETQVLESRGFSMQAYAAVMTGATVITVVVYWLLGGLILWRQENLGIGLSVSLILLVIPITMIADIDNVSANYPGLLIPLILLGLLGMVFVLLFLYLFPNGRIAPRWAPVPLVGSVVIAGIFILESNGVIGFSQTGERISILTFIAIIFFAFGVQVYRYLRVSSEIEQLQTRWVLLGLSVFVIGLPVWFLFFGGFLELPPGEARLLGSIGAWLLSMLTTLALPVTLAIAILQHRLWDIDLIIRRSLIYAALTGTLAMLYFALVIGLQRLLPTQTQITTILSTLTIAGLFSPLRRRIQKVIDRRLYRQRYDTEQVLAAFSSTLRDKVDLDHLQGSILAVVAEAMQPDSASLWLRDPGSMHSKSDQEP